MSKIFFITNFLMFHFLVKLLVKNKDILRMEKQMVFGFHITRRMESYGIKVISRMVIEKVLGFVTGKMES